MVDLLVCRCVGSPLLTLKDCKCERDDKILKILKYGETIKNVRIDR